MIKTHWASIGLVTALIISIQVKGESRGLVNKLLLEIQTKSTEIKIQELETKSSLMLEGKTRLLFKPTGYFEASYSDTDSPQTSPFSTSNVVESRYGLGVEKQWMTGFKTDLSYTLQDRENSFFNGVNNSFIAPTVELSFTTNLIQDVLHKRYYHLSKSAELNAEAIELNNNVVLKETLTKGLLSFSDIIEAQDEISLQERICSKVKDQSRKLKEKRDRKVISRREYLLGTQELLSCEVLIDQLKRNLVELKDSFNSKYGFSFEKFKKLDAQKVFSELEIQYNKYEKSSSKVDIENKDEIKAIASQVKALESKQLELSALAKSDLELELSAGATGLGDRFSDSHEGVEELKFPFIYVGLKLGLPFVDRDAKETAAAGIYRVQALKAKQQFLKDQGVQRFNTLKKTLSNDFSIYKKYIRSMDISNEILVEARKDFSNGRIDYVTLVDFNTRIVEEQKKLSNHRSLLLVRLIEYLDYYQFFNRYL